VHLEGRRGHLHVEQLLGIVLAALQLRDDDGPLRLAVVRLVEAPSIRSASMNSIRSSASVDAVSRYVVWSIQV
jgi:hypothetical protein